jgi:hypothetical protein
MSNSQKGPLPPSPLRIEDWDKGEIKRLAMESGRPLEVRCAQAFLAKGWRVRLGTLYRDRDNTLRELDFLAEKECEFHATVRLSPCTIYLKIRILGSCKGFPANSYPATYSLSVPSASLEPTRVAFHGYGGGLQTLSNYQSLKQEAAAALDLVSAFPDQVIGFDILEYQPISNRRGGGPAYVSKTDKDLFGGLASALFASLYWVNEDFTRYSRAFDPRQGRIFLNIPLLALANPFWNVSINDGKTGEPELRHSAIHVSLFPLQEGKPAEPVTSLIWDAGKLDLLTDRLKKFEEYLQNRIREDWLNSRFPAS